MSINADSVSQYVYVNVKAPRMAGMRLRVFTWMMESWLIGPFLRSKLKRDNLITKVFVETRYQEPPLYQPQFPIEESKETGVIRVDSSLSCPERVMQALQCLSNRKEVDGGYSFRHWTIQDYANAYKSGRLTPIMVAERILSALDDSQKASMGIFIASNPNDILQQAAQSTIRYQQGNSLSALDGVPIAVKDEIDCLPYSTTGEANGESVHFTIGECLVGGTTWMCDVRKVKDDAACVKRLRECGAMLIGKTNMHELGQGITGINPHYGASRNPYDRKRASGGSSGGSAAAVCSGLCPAALGVDGGGSVRMPAALCGIVGLKSTFGRITSCGLLPLSWTVASVGVLAGTIEDTMIMYAAIEGHLLGDPIVSIPPQLTLPLLNDFKTIETLKLAKYTEWFDDSDKDVKNACYKALSLLQAEYGCESVEVIIPELEEMRLAHFVTIGSECYTSVGTDYQKEDSAADTRVGFSFYRSFTNTEYIAAQCMRHRQTRYHMEIFENADIIVTPTTGCTAPLVLQDSLKYGELNYVNGAKLMRYQIAGNFVGLPAISVPVGYDKQGMPIGLQLIGRPWCEATLLRVAFAIEGLCASFKRRPEVFYEIL